MSEFEFPGEIIVRFDARKSTDGEFDDVAEEYAIVRRPEATIGLILYAKWSGKWEPNPWSERPALRWLLENWNADTQSSSISSSRGAK